MPLPNELSNPTYGWTEHEWEQYHLADTQVAALQLVRDILEPMTVQDLLDRLISFGYEDDRSRRAVLYLLESGDLMLEGTPQRLVYREVTWRL